MVVERIDLQSVVCWQCLNVQHLIWGKPQFGRRKLPDTQKYRLGTCQRISSRWGLRHRIGYEHVRQTLSVTNRSTLTMTRRLILVIFLSCHIPVLTIAHHHTEQPPRLQSHYVGHQASRSTRVVPPPSPQRRRPFPIHRPWHHLHPLFFCACSC